MFLFGPRVILAARVPRLSSPYFPVIITVIITVVITIVNKVVTTFINTVIITIPSACRPFLFKIGIETH